MSDPSTEITEDLFLNGRLRLRQPKRGHRAGHDAILLAASTPADAGDRVVDFGAGVGTAGLALAWRVSGVDLVLVERDAQLAELARANADLNGIAAHVVVEDIATAKSALAAQGLKPDSVDVLMMNPPFNDDARHRPSPDPSRQSAHMAADDTLEIWIRAAHRVLKSRGVLTMIWRAEGLSDVLAALVQKFGSIEILPVQPKPDAPAIRILVKAIKGGRAPMVLLPGLALNAQTGPPSERAQAILRGEATLSWGEGPKNPTAPKK